MKKFIVLAFLISACSEGNTEGSIASINGEPITKAELSNILVQFTGLPDAKLENYPEDFQKELLNKYIDKKLLIEAGRDAGIHKNEEVVKQIKQAEDFLVEKKILQDIVKAETTEDKMKTLYEEVIAARAGEKEAKASHILLETEDEAKAIAKKLKAGQSFEKLAEKNSIDPGSKINGGDLGYFTAEKMIQVFSEKVFSMKKGGISEPVKSTFGWHVIKLIDLRDLTIPTLEQSTPALKAELARRAVDKKTAELKEKSDIKITYDFPTVKPEVLEEKAEPAAEEQK